MASRKCAVPSCSETRYRFTRFPVKNKNLIKKWLRLINNPKLFLMSEEDIYNLFRVCTKHFENKWIKEEPYPGTTSRAVMPDAYPTLFLSPNNTDTTTALKLDCDTSTIVTATVKDFEDLNIISAIHMDHDYTTTASHKDHDNKMTAILLDHNYTTTAIQMDNYTTTAIHRDNDYTTTAIHMDNDNTATSATEIEHVITVGGTPKFWHCKINVNKFFKNVSKEPQMIERTTSNIIGSLNKTLKEFILCQLRKSQKKIRKVGALQRKTKS